MTAASSGRRRKVRASPAGSRSPMMISGQKATRTRKRLKNEAKRRANNARKRGARVEKSPHIRDDPPQPSPMTDFVLKKGGAAATPARRLTEEEKAARRAAVLERPLSRRRMLLWHVRAERDYWIRRNAEYIRRRAAGRPSMRLPLMEIPCFFCGATLWIRHVRSCVCKAGPCWYRRREQYNRTYEAQPGKKLIRREYELRRYTPERRRIARERWRRYAADPARAAARKAYAEEYRSRPGYLEMHRKYNAAYRLRVKSDPEKYAEFKRRCREYESTPARMRARNAHLKRYRMKKAASTHAKDCCGGGGA